MDSKNCRATVAFPCLRGGLIVSCQAEGADPFNDPDGIARFAQAACMGGAAGIRARQAENISAVNLRTGNLGQENFMTNTEK